MGPQSASVARPVTKTLPAPPGQDEFEVTLLGPGYGESIVMHVGNGVWVVIDSCIDPNGIPRPLQYLEGLGLDPSEQVALIIATHWHDDHIRGMSQLVETCRRADFCCSSALCQREFLAAVDALERRHATVVGSGVREIHQVISQLSGTTARQLRVAVANRRLFARDTCEVWALSPSDAVFASFLRTIGSLIPGDRQAKTRVPTLSPNEVAVALWIQVGTATVLLGSDLEKSGWISVLQNQDRPNGKASVFKVPHHGSEGAHEPDVWRQMLVADPFALLTPWLKGGMLLPRPRDVRRLQSCTANGYSTTRFALASGTKPRASRRLQLVDRTLRDSGVKFRRVPMSPGGVQLRRSLVSQGHWKVKAFGSACHLKDFTFG